MRRLWVLVLIALCISVTAAAAEEEEFSFWDLIEIDPSQAVEAGTPPTATPIPENDGTLTAREDFINRIFDLGYELYVKADGKAQRAIKKGDIYLCKNFTTHIFNELRDDYCMAEYPDVRLRIPNNEQECYPYSYGVEWEDVSAAKGNPFYVAASFRYDKNLSYDENFELACEFMRNAQRGDFFQMSADYEYGMGAHSAIMMSYDAEKDEIHWMDSNMRGYSKVVNGEKLRYGICQYDEVRSVEWWAGTFCHTRRGATLYRLRDDITYRED